MDKILCLLLATLLSFAGAQTVVLTPPTTKFSVAETKSVVTACEVPEWTDTTNKADLAWIDNNGAPVTSEKTDDRVYIMRYSNKVELYVQNIDKKDSGSWTCSFTPVAGQASDVSIEIEIWQDITFIDLKLLQQPVKDSDALIECKVQSRPSATVTWYYDGKSIGTGDDVRFLQEKTGLRISKIQESDNGFYSCRAAITSKSTFQTKKIEVKVTIPPTITSPPASPDAGVEGQMYTVYCKAEGKPKPDYTFYRGGVTKTIITNNNRITVNTEEGSMEITKLEMGDKGEYNCKAGNIGGNADSSFFIDVKVPAKIKDVVSGKGVENGEGVIKCIATGNPLPDIKFIKVGHPAPITQTATNDRLVLKFTPAAGQETQTLELVIRELRAEDTGEYTCEAINSHGQETRNVSLDVQFKPSFTKDTIPITYTWSNSPQALKCVVKANPLPAIKWKRDDVEISNGDLYTIEHKGDESSYTVTSTLLVKVDYQAADKQIGDYLCEGSNLIGQSSKILSLREAKPPNPPAAVKIVEWTATSMQLVVDRPLEDGGLPVTQYHIEYEHNGEMKEQTVQINNEARRDDEAVPTTVVNVNELTPSTLYRFKVSAANEVGVGTTTTVERQTREISPPSRVTITSGKSSQHPDEYRLMWNTPQDGGLPIKHYEIQYQTVTLNLTSNEVEKYKSAKIDIKVDKSLNSHDIKSLLPNTTYRILIVAVNDKGRSRESDINMRTAIGSVEDEEPEEVSSGIAGVSMGVIIGVLILLILIIFIVVDIICYFKKSCGVTYTIKTALCGGEAAAVATTDVEAGDKAGEPLLDKKEPPPEENKEEQIVDEKEPDDKLETPVITLDEPEETDNAEKEKTDEQKEVVNEEETPADKPPE